MQNLIYDIPENIGEKPKGGKFRCHTIVFTSYESEEKTVELLRREQASWYLYGREICPTTQKKHLQGMAYYKSAKSWTLLQKAKCWIARCISPLDSIIYCQKEKDFVEEGVRPCWDRKTQKLTVKAAMTMTREELMELSPFMYNQTIKAIEHAKKTEVRPAPEWPEDGFRPWQKEVLDWLDDIPDRVITFLVDIVGGMGKTTFFGWLSHREDICYMGLMTKENALHHADTSGTVKTYIMDLARSESEFLPYATLEKLKDGYWTSGKYEGKKCMVGRRRVIVCMNTYPNKTKLSKDRYEVYIFTSKYTLQYVPFESIPE